MRLLSPDTTVTVSCSTNQLRHPVLFLCIGKLGGRLERHQLKGAPMSARPDTTGAGHIIRISSKSLFISLIPFKKWNLYNVYILSTQTDIFRVFIYFNFDDYNWQLMKTPNSVSQKIWILLKTNTKKGFLEILANWKVWTWKVWACTALNT